MPSTVFVGLGLPAAKSALHCRAAAFEQVAGRPTTFGLPGWHRNSLGPSPSPMLFPLASVPTIRASPVIVDGPAAIARAICASLDSPATPPVSGTAM